MVPLVIGSSVQVGEGSEEITVGSDGEIPPILTAAEPRTLDEAKRGENTSGSGGLYGVDLGDKFLARGHLELHLGVGVEGVKRAAACAVTAVVTTTAAVTATATAIAPTVSVDTAAASSTRTTIG